MADIEKDETSSMIASNKVEGTAVYGPGGDKLGSIYNFMVDKRTGQVEYAVLQFGGDEEGVSLYGNRRPRAAHPRTSSRRTCRRA